MGYTNTTGGGAAWLWLQVTKSENKQAEIKKPKWKQKVKKK